MSQGGMLIRLIDVVLILLFGFISISEISERSQIILAKSSETPPSPPDKELVLVVGVSGDGEYLVDAENRTLPTVDDLEAYLVLARERASAKGGSVRVRIRPHWNTPIKYTMRVAAICDRLSLTKGMDVRRTVEGGI